MVAIDTAATTAITMADTESCDEGLEGMNYLTACNKFVGSVRAELIRLNLERVISDIKSVVS